MKKTVLLAIIIVVLAVAIAFCILYQYGWNSLENAETILGKYVWFPNSETNIAGVKGSNYLAEDLCGCLLTEGAGYLSHTYNKSIAEPWIICGNYKEYGGKDVEILGTVKRVYVDLEKKEFGYTGEGCLSQEIFGCYKGYVNCIKISRIKTAEQ